jgi:DnaK suppressor protein
MTAVAQRESALRQILIDRRRDAEDEGRGGQGEIELTLSHMKAETRALIDVALSRLDAGSYGACAACMGEIAARRLRALPFAIRCEDCEAHRERCERQRDGQRRHHERGRGDLPLFSDLAQS